jgi:hypothetical protein
MVIQDNMSPQAIVEIWGETITVFEQYNLPLTGQMLNEIMAEQELDLLLNDLNRHVSS